MDKRFISINFKLETKIWFMEIVKLYDVIYIC